jgi:hypothetical protein
VFQPSRGGWWAVSHRRDSQRLSLPCLELWRLGPSFRKGGTSHNIATVCGNLARVLPTLACLLRGRWRSPDSGMQCRATCLRAPVSVGQRRMGKQSSGNYHLTLFSQPLCPQSLPSRWALGTTTHLESGSRAISMTSLKRCRRRCSRRDGLVETQQL